MQLPLSVAARRHTPTADRTANALSSPTQLRGLRILVLEDDGDASEMMKSMLEDCDATVAVSSSVPRALELVDSFRPDVIVSDIGLPGRDGYSFIAELRSRPAESRGRIPAVALTAHARVEDRAQALYAGFNNHVPKPIDPIELFAVIASLRPRAFDEFGE